MTRPLTGSAVVVGGGIAGNAAALALLRAGIEVTVLEQRSAVAGQGSFLRLNPNGLDALAALQVLEPVLKVSFPLTRVERFSADGELIAHRQLVDPLTDRGLDPRFVTWAQLRQVLRVEAEQRGAKFRYDVRVTDAVSAKSGASAVLADGEQLTADVLVGADGTNSVIRTAIDPAAPAPEHRGGWTIYGHTPAKPASVPGAPSTLRAYFGPSHWIAQIDNPETGETFFFTTIKTDERLPTPGPSTNDWRTDLLARWPDTAAPAVGILTGATSIRASDDLALPHLPRWHRDRIVVIGDAAHTAPPNTEQGAAMALEDAAVLGQCLRDHSPEAALARFEAVRRERVETIIGLATGRRTTTESPDWSYRHHINWAEQIQ